MITGAGGMLAHAVHAVIEQRGHAAIPLDRRALDVTDEAAVSAAVLRERPDAVIQCAAWTRVDDAEREETAALRTNGDGVAHVARACLETGARLIYPSTDYVFDGHATTPIPPDAPTAPINAYGRSKLAGEAMAALSQDALTVRTSWLYGRGGRNFVTTILDRARAGQALRVIDDQHGAPTWTRDLAGMMVMLLELDAPAGVYHATNSGATTWYGLACAALEIAGIEADITPTTSAEFATAARRPAYSVLDCSATYALVGTAPDWRAALGAAIAEGF
ncbi:dTDP-4-dehydrorhamnose reductase [soil metagenome]